PKDEVTLDIADATGTIVRRYSSAMQPHAMDMAKMETAPEWHTKPVIIAIRPGMHRFVWPLRLAAPEALADGNPFADGVSAPPGEYRAPLPVDGRHWTQPLRVNPDPRLTLPDDAYAQQFALARRIEQERIRVANAAHQIDALLEQIAGRRKEAASS